MQLLRKICRMRFNRKQISSIL